MASIRKRGNSYQIRVSCGYDTSHKQIFKSMTYTPPASLTKKQLEKELERQALMFEEKCRNGLILSDNIKFSDFAEKWLADYAEKQLKKSTVARYKELLKRINLAIGHINIGKIQPNHLMEFYNNLAESGIRADTTYKATDELNKTILESGLTNSAIAEKTGVSLTTLMGYRHGLNARNDKAEVLSAFLKKDINELFVPVGSSKLSPKTILHHHRLISAIMTTAVQWQVIFSNPCDRVKPPKVDRKEANYLDEVQAAHLLELLDNEPIQYQVIVKLLIYTGLRRGELCGLEWRDIDFDNNTICVSRNSLYLKSDGIYEDTPKNYTSNRVIKVSQFAMSMLKAYKKWQAEERLKLGSKWIDSGKIFTAWNGTPINPTFVSAWFRKFINGTDLPHISIHSLRHTNATLLIASGTPLKTVSNRLGHANVTTTGNIYTHAIQSADEVAAETLQDILNPVKKNKSV